jgi:hypothetical protein
MNETEEKGNIRPEHIREAYRRLLEEVIISICCTVLTYFDNFNNFIYNAYSCQQLAG